MIYSRRPINLLDLHSAVAKLIGTSNLLNQEVVLEYLGPDGVRSIAAEIDLQEAYILHEDRLLLIGIRLLSAKVTSTEPTNEFECK